MLLSQLLNVISTREVWDTTKDVLELINLEGHKIGQLTSTWITMLETAHGKLLLDACET